MANGQLYPVLRLLRTLAGANPGGDLTDRQLIELFRSSRDQEAFAAIVDRHGPMILSACRRILNGPQDVEDAFQATFLVLVRKIASIGRPELLANWLYGVACRTALRLRSEKARRAGLQREMNDMPAAPKNGEASWEELRPVLDEELRLLPDRYRIPLVLCYLEGKTYVEAARYLGWPEGTVSGRLARGREILRKRLMKRGLTLSASALGTLLVENAASALVVPQVLAAATANAALAWAGGTAAIASSQVMLLTEGVLNSMFWTKIKIVAAVMLSCGLLGVGGGTYSTWAREKQETQKTDNKPVESKKAAEVKPAVSGTGNVAAVPASDQDAVAEAPKPAGINRALELQETLNKVVKFEGVNDPKATLGEFLETLSATYALTFVVNERAIKEDGLIPNGELLSCAFAENPLPRMANVRLSTLLRQVLARVTSQSAITYVIRKDAIELTTFAALKQEFGLPETVNLAASPLVTVKLDGVSLDEALKQIGQQTDFNIVLDNRIAPEKNKITATLLAVPVDTAVRILADMVDMEAVLLDNVLYVTTPSKAAKLQREQNKRKGLEEAAPADSPKGANPKSS